MSDHLPDRARLIEAARRGTRERLARLEELILQLFKAHGFEVDLDPDAEPENLFGWAPLIGLAAFSLLIGLLLGWSFPIDDFLAKLEELTR